MKRLKKFWKTKIRVLLPNPIKRLLAKIGNSLFPFSPNIYSTTSRDEFLLYMSKINEKQEKNNAAQSWWSIQTDWTAKFTTPKRYNILSNFILQKFVPFLQPDFVVCDLACACGDFSFLIADKVKQIDAFDLAEGMIKTAIRTVKKKKINNIVFKQADALTINLGTNKYDAFMMLGLLTCIDDPYIIEIVKKVHHSMKDRAKLIIKDSLTLCDSTEYIYCSASGYSAYYHNQKEYLDFFNKNGFKLLDIVSLEEDKSISCIFEKN